MQSGMEMIILMWLAQSLAIVYNKGVVHLTSSIQTYATIICKTRYERETLKPNPATKCQERRSPAGAAWVIG